MASAEEFRALAFSSAYLAFRKYHMKAVSGDSDLNGELLKCKPSFLQHLELVPLAAVQMKRPFGPAITIGVIAEPPSNNASTLSDAFSRSFSQKFVRIPASSDSRRMLTGQTRNVAKFCEILNRPLMIPCLLNL